MDGNEIDTEGGIAVAQAMANKNNLKFLNLNCNQFGESVFCYYFRFSNPEGHPHQYFSSLGVVVPHIQKASLVFHSYMPEIPVPFELILIFIFFAFLILQERRAEKILLSFCKKLDVWNH